MRRLIACSGAAIALGCASIGAPPGGPTRTTPPAIIAVTPDSGAVNVRAKDVVFTFDVVTADRPVGAPDLERVFIVSPSEGPPEIRWRRERIEVRPRGGFRDSTAYAVTMLPGIADLRGNALGESRTIVFSTGPRIPPYAVHGRAFDWQGQRPAPNAVVQVIRRPDSLSYVGVADSSGQFTVGPLEEGRYTVRAFVDANANRMLDSTESWDSVAVTVGASSPFVELLTIARDTVAPRLLTVNMQDSLTLAASFDRPLDPRFPLAPELFRVQRADSTPLVIARVRTRAEAAAEVAARDSTRADSIARADTARAAPPTRPAPGVRPGVGNVAPRPSRPAPAREVLISLDTANALQPGTTYRVTARNMRGLLGSVRTSDRVITAPEPSAQPGATPPAER